MVAINPPGLEVVAEEVLPSSGIDDPSVGSCEFQVVAGGSQHVSLSSR